MQKWICKLMDWLYYGAKNEAAVWIIHVYLDEH